MQIVTKIKLFISTYTEELAVSAIIIFVAFSCFYLGRASLQNTASQASKGIYVEESRSGSIHNEKAPKSASEQTDTSNLAAVKASEKQSGVVASKNGKRYYYPRCSGISRISPANIVHYGSVAEAEKFGLTLAANCTPNK